MSYDISIHVKAEGCDIYPKIADGWGTEKMHFWH